MSDEKANQPKPSAETTPQAPASSGKKEKGDASSPSGPPDPAAVFVRNELYPEPGKLFTFRRKPLEAIKEGCIFVIDNNVLLIPYKVESQSLEAIKTVYEPLAKAKRIVIPAQAAREFFVHQSSHVGNPIDHVVKLKQALAAFKKASPGEYPFFESLDEYTKVRELWGQVSASFPDYTRSLDALHDKVRQWSDDDPVLKLYTVFTEDHVVEPDIDEDGLVTELSYRYKHKIPPGYKDQTKDDSGVGDLLIWKTILKVGTEKKCPVIFVSHEKKADWCIKSHGEPISPRIELVDEFRRTTDGQSFHIMSLAEFIKWFGATPEAVDDIQRAELAQAESGEGEPRATAENDDVLLMDLTREMGPDRITQVQPPLGVWVEYFNLNANDPPRYTLINRKDPSAAPEPRTPSKHHHTWTIEVADAGLPRPAILKMRRIGPTEFEYWVFREGEDPEFATYDEFLESNPNPKRSRGRRWVVTSA